MQSGEKVLKIETQTVYEILVQLRDTPDSFVELCRASLDHIPHEWEGHYTEIQFYEHLTSFSVKVNSECDILDIQSIIRACYNILNLKKEKK